MSKALIAGAFISVAGLALAGVSAAFARDEIKKLNKYKSGEITLKEANKITIEGDAGTVNVHHSDTTTSYVKYNVLEQFDVKYDEEENEVKLKSKWVWGLLTVTWFCKNNSVMDVYLTDKDYEAYLELNAGEFNLDEGFTFTTLTVDVSAGNFNILGDCVVKDDASLKLSAGDINSKGRITVNDEATLKVSAGDMNINYIEAKKANFKISAGDINAKVKSDDIQFKISAGDITLNIVGDKADYTIDIDKSAGSCNVNDQDGGSKKLDGDISAGRAVINFVNE